MILRDSVGEIDRQYADDGVQAIKTAIIMLARLNALNDGDILRVAKEPNRAPKLIEF